MDEVNIKDLFIGSYLCNNIPNDINIVGKIKILRIKYKYAQLDLSRLECDEIYYFDQEGESIKNHILPNSLKKLYCSSNKLTSLPNLPNSLEILYCYNNQLTSFANTQLPNSLEILYCYNNQLTSLPNLPNSLRKLYCWNNQLKSLPELPNLLEILHCYNNKLTYFSNDQLPNSLEKLNCSENKLTILPELQNSLKELNCHDNELINLPELPNSLKELNCRDNKLTSFGNIKLPNLLEELNCKNNKLTSLPDLPNSLKELICSNNQLTSLPDFSYIDHEIELFFNQDLPISYIPYNTNIKLINSYYGNKINIEGYEYNPITNQEELNKYMDFILEFNKNKIKSARK